MVTAEEMERIASRAAQKALREMLLVMGVDTNDPRAMIEMQKDFAHVRGWRISIEKVRTQGLLTAVGIFITFVSGTIWYALRGSGH